MNRSCKRTLWCLGSLGMVSGCVLLINAVDVASYTCAPVSRADAALVLGSSVTSGEPSPIFKARLDIAAELFHKHTVSAVIVSGGAFSEGELSEAEGGERYLRTLGVPPDRIFQEPQARSTRQNILLGFDHLSRRGLRTWVVVSDRYHLRRAELVARELGIPFSCAAVADRGGKRLPLLLSEARKVTFMRFLRLLRGILWL